jgi:hypothetical protein
MVGLRKRSIGIGIAALLALSGCGLIPTESAAERYLFESRAGEVSQAMKRG